MILAGTGHRPTKLGGYGAPVFTRLTALAVAAIETYHPTQIVSGMALGWDQALATAAITQKIPLVAAVPFMGQETMWPAASRKTYAHILAGATDVIVVCPGSYSAAKMQTRNEWMVDHCDSVLALWDGTGGGTGNCIAYAEKVERPIINLWSNWTKYA